MIGDSLSHYKILEKLGEGGMGEVYVAEDTHLKRNVALKVLSPRVAADPEGLERFQREAEAVAALNHPSIVTIFSVEEADGVRFITMELVDGKSLDQLIPKGGMEIRKLFTLAESLAEALTAAHGRGIAHRDLKPLNIMVDDENRIKILDFGLAKLVESDTASMPDDHERPTGMPLTQQGMVMGTVPYMAPEQLEGKQVDHRVDIFSLGVLLYEMATGTRPFHGDSSAATISAILRDTPTPVLDRRPDLPRQLARIIGHCLEKEARDRFQTARDVFNELKSLRQEVELGDPLLSGAVQAIPSSPAAGPRKSRLVIGIAATALLLLGGLWVLRGVLPGRTTGRVVTGDQRKRTVVLPFENLGQPDDEYFAAGVTDEITSRLAVVEGMAVISRKSAMTYAETDKTTRQIGEELDVDYVLEGTVRWARMAEGLSRVRIVPTLIRVSDDIQLWTSTYERALDDIFQVQSDIAQAVVEKLGVTLLEPGQGGVEARPTDNVAAYQAYLRGRSHLSQASSKEEMDLAVLSFEQAVSLDPGFARAHARLAQLHSLFYFAGFDRSEKRREDARLAIESALELAPKSPEVQLSLGYYQYWVHGAYTKALDAFGRAGSGRPDSSDVLEATGFVLRRQGYWEESLSNLQRAFELSPRDPNLVEQLATSYQSLRRYAEAVQLADRFITLVPDQAKPYTLKADLLRAWKGTTEEARAALEMMPRTDDPSNQLDWYHQEIFEGRYEAALDRISRVPDDLIPTQTALWPKPLLEAMAHELMGETNLAARGYERAAALLEAKLEAWPDDPRVHSMLGYAYAGLGRKREAVRAGQQAVRLHPYSTDHLQGPDYLQQLAFVYTRVGDADAALTQIDRLLSMPSTLSVRLLELDPWWEPLRSDPRFGDIIAIHGP